MYCYKIFGLLEKNTKNTTILEKHTYYIYLISLKQGYTTSVIGGGVERKNPHKDKILLETVQEIGHSFQVWNIHILIAYTVYQGK